MPFKWFLAACALFVAACSSPAVEMKALDGDSFLGPADAKVVVTEYGAPTCPSCKGWHDAFWEQLKSNYIDTGKIKFVFRELPSHNPPMDAAIFYIARCSGQDSYFKVIDLAFERQAAIERAYRSGDAQSALIDLGKAVGMSAEQVEACTKDPKAAQRIFDVQTDADKLGVTGTPTFFINGKMVDDARYETMAREIDAALAAE
ncbi:MAG: thioredoxin domain-containing protein [Hyphomonadaceae bacterium]